MRKKYTPSEEDYTKMPPEKFISGGIDCSFEN
jgi:hypothetical protein